MEKHIDGNKLIREICSVLILFFCAFLFISIYSYSPKDPSFNISTSSRYIHNWGGIIGSYIGGLIVELFGNISWIIIIFLLWGGLSGLFNQLRIKWFRVVGIFLVFFLLNIFLGSPIGNNFTIGSIKGGGYLGKYLFDFLYKYLNFGGILILSLFLLILGIQLIFLFLWSDIFSLLHKALLNIWRAFKNIFLIVVNNVFKRDRGTQQKFACDESKKIALDKIKKTKVGDKLNKSERGLKLVKKELVAKEKNNVKAQDSLNFVQYKYPPIDILDEVKNEENEVDNKYLEDMSSRLLSCLKDFGVEGELLNIKPGPVVTMFEFKPAPGIKISRIAQLNSDIALAMKAVSVRIEAPIPGKDYIGIEIPNKKRKTVFFREIVQSSVFQRAKSGLPIIIGQDIQGNPRVEDLSKMPHLLVAGATGAGKSVCLNSIIISILMRFSPEEVKFLLIDPKRIEMASYSGLPHLIHPVVTEMDLAKTALEWAVHEMEQRYDLMARMGARNITAFNEKIKNQDELEEEILPLPYLVIIIDEMADLMLTAGKEAEAQIIRLAQLARAAGIHLILATQRPSVDVVTGLIKANFPARIAFQVTSKHDSRTILDTVGAEHLLGKGDMLFKPPAGRIERIHGAYISDGEISRVIDFWHKKYPQKEQLDLLEWKKEADGAANSQVGGDVYDDPMYNEAVKFVMEQGRVSISMLQRYLRIGFNRAARFVEQMEKDGIIGPQEGSKPRIVLKK